ncbi:MAG: hypothetical protein JXN62_10435 [Bacteroidales bacterium]|nr:hypothetical protein [Bacteroidales bacterium]
MLVTLLMLALMAEIPANCNYDRTTLTGYIDTYFKALVDNNPTAVPLADNVKITFNGDVKSLARSFWESAESIVYRFDIVNTRRGDTGTEAVIKNSDGSLTMYMLRMKVLGDRITEIETIKCNEGEADHIWDADNLSVVSPAYQLSIREVERDSYYDLIGTAESYWRAFQTNGSPEYRPARLLPDSKRYENGMQATGMIVDGEYESTAKGFDTGFFKERNIWDRRYPVVDEERGIVLSIVRFGIKAGLKSRSEATTHNRLVAEFFVIRSGWIKEIQAVIVNRSDELPTGWEPDYGPDRAVEK